MGEKLLRPIRCVRLGVSMDEELNRAAKRLGIPKAHVMRLAIRAGLPLIVEQDATREKDRGGNGS